MPPIPRPKAVKPRRERGSVATEHSSASPSPHPRSRTTTKLDVLQQDLERMYMMIGTMVSPFGRFYPVLTPVGDNLKAFSEEAAEAWIKLAEKDVKVKAMLMSLTEASTWGNVIGIHLAIFASAIPGGSAMGAMMGAEPLDPIGQAVEQARAAGLTEEEIAYAHRMAAQMQAQQQMAARDQSTGGPGDTVSVSTAPEFDPQGEFQTAAPSPVQTVARPGIVSPEELGVTNPGNDSTVFPADTQPPNGSAN